MMMLFIDDDAILSKKAYFRNMTNPILNVMPYWVNKRWTVTQDTQLSYDLILLNVQPLNFKS